MIYEALTDPEVPPLPPHITFEMATVLSKALLKSDANAGQIVRQPVKGKLKELLTR